MNYVLDFYGITMIVNVYMGHASTREEPGEEGYLEDVTLIIEGEEIHIDSVPNEMEEWIGEKIYHIERNNDDAHAAAYADHIAAIKEFQND